MCEGGNVRSVSMAWALKMKNQDAIAIGWRFISLETKLMLFNWCDHIILMQQKFDRFVPKEFKNKCLVVDVGEDCYGNPFHPELSKFTWKVVEEWEKKNFKF